MKPEREKEMIVKYISQHPNFKVQDVQRLIKRGYVYTSKLLEEMGLRK